MFVLNIWNNLQLFSQSPCKHCIVVTTTNLQRYIFLHHFFWCNKPWFHHLFHHGFHSHLASREEEFLGKLKGIKGISMVETQTYTLEEATGWPQGVWCSRGGGGNSLGEALRIPFWKPNGKIRGITPLPLRIKVRLWLPWLRPWAERWTELGMMYFPTKWGAIWNPRILKSSQGVDGSLNTCQ